MNLKIYFSNITDVYFNLSLEEYLLDNEPDSFILLLYVNDKSVVIGRNQNPWLETNIEYLKRNDIKLARRISGGGTVYHDLGNLNICWICPKSEYNRNFLNSKMHQSLKDIGIDCTIEKRGDIFIKNKKISGHAYRYKKDYVLQHCTILIDSELDVLRKSLIGLSNIYEYKSVESIKSPVINLSEVKKQIGIKLFKELFIENFKKDFNVTTFSTLMDSESLSNRLKFDSIMDRIKSTEWIYKRTPEFKFYFKIRDHNSTERINFHFTKGKINILENSKDKEFPEVNKMFGIIEKLNFNNFNLVDIKDFNLGEGL